MYGNDDKTSQAWLKRDLGQGKPSQLFREVSTDLDTGYGGQWVSMGKIQIEHKALKYTALFVVCCDKDNMIAQWQWSEHNEYE